ncbi:MAG: hypothetical protein HQ538_06035 [Parcubacteria group bacterium]|nr:hypothetical protein [Parcubacteria group bacterium]
MQYVFGLLGIGFGILMTLKSEWFLNIVGRIASIEKYLGTFGGSRLFYQMLGVFIVALSTLYMVGALGGILEAIIGGIFGRN